MNGPNPPVCGWQITFDPTGEQLTRASHHPYALVAKAKASRLRYRSCYASISNLESLIDQKPRAVGPGAAQWTSSGCRLPKGPVGIQQVVDHGRRDDPDKLLYLW